MMKSGGKSEGRNGVSNFDFLLNFSGPQWGVFMEGPERVCFIFMIFLAVTWRNFLLQKLNQFPSDFHAKFRVYFTSQFGQK